MAPNFILFGSNDNLGGGFGGYQVPASDEFIATGTSGAQVMGTSFEIYDANDTGGVVGGDISDIAGGYLLFSWVAGQNSFTGGDGSNFVLVHIREGSTASTVDGGGAVGLQHQLEDFNGSGSVSSSFVTLNRPSGGEDSEWGIQVNATIASRKTMFNASLMMVGQKVGDGFSGSTFGTRDVTWDGAFATTHDFNDQTTGDETIDKTALFRLGFPHTHLLIAQVRNKPTTQNVNLRWSFEIDGTPLVNVRTDTATPGAVRTGRGFQYQSITAASKSTHLMHSTIRVVQLSAGDHEYKVRCNRHETDAATTEQLQRLQCFAFNTNIFSQFYRKERNTGLTLTGTTLVDVDEWQQDIIVDGTSKVWIGLGTSSHGSKEAAARFSIFRDGVELIDSGTGALGEYPSESGDGSLDMSSPPTRDSDNNTIPVSIFWYDDPPVGTYRYTVKASSTSSTEPAFGNVNDNGEDGFVGTFFVAELKLATTGF